MTTFKNLPPPPSSREAILETMGPQRAQIYRAVRKILDDFEVVAPWKQLYYPPTEIEEFLRIQTCLLSLIEEIPYRISEMTVQILAQAFRDLFADLPSGTAGTENAETILGLLDPVKARAATRSSLRIVFEAVDAVHSQALADSLKLLLKWMIDRQSPEPELDLSGEDFEQAIQEFPTEVVDDAMKEILGNAQFYFDGIHTMTAGDLEKLRARIEFFQTAGKAHLSAQERVFTCEISADLKGKYTSAIMGAASNLVSEGIWNGAEVEPVLFPEKAEEFDRNEQLVKALREVLGSIRNFPEEVPLVELMATWDQRKRVDRYALSHMYGFLGTLGKLMKESSRRALYSGDYHQVQTRENRLSNRVNELNMLHNKSWEVLDETDPNIQDFYPQMVDKAVELAAVLDVELLKKMIGEDTVALLLQIVSIEGEKRRELDARSSEESTSSYQTPESQALRARVDERRQPLIELLYDEDLQTFLELLLGSVSKRASFAVRKRQAESHADLTEVVAEARAEMAAAEAVPPGAEAVPLAPEALAAVEAVPVEPEEMVHFQDMSVLDLDADAPTQVTPPSAVPEPSPPSASPGPGAAGGDGAGAKLHELETLQGYLADFLAATHPHRKSFDLVHRLLTHKGMIPPAMMQSIVPFLENLNDTVIPQLARVSALGEMPITYQSELLQYCRDLSRRDLTPQEMKTGVLTNMEGLLRLLGDIEAIAQELIDTHGGSRRSSSSSGSGGTGGMLGSVDDFLGSLE